MEGFVYTERPEGYDYNKELMLLEAFDNYIKNNDISLPTTWKNKSYREIIQEMIFSIFTAKKNELTVLPSMMGLGKSTFLYTLLRTLINIDKEFIKNGCIVVKERVEDVIRFESDFIDLEGYGDIDTYERKKLISGFYGFNEKYCLKKLKESDYKKGICSMCEKSDCMVIKSRKKVNVVPIVVMTHEMLYRQALNGDLGMLRSWKAGEDDYKHYRRFLFIDEKPKFFNTYKIYYEELEVFINEIYRIIMNTKIEVDIDLIKKRANDLFNNMKDTNDIKRIEDTNIKLDNNDVIIELNKASKIWKIRSSEKNEHLFVKFYNLFLNGAIRSNNIYFTYEYYNYQFDDIKTIILDGTARNDLIYPEKANIAEVDDFRDFSNVTIRHYLGCNLSKSYLKDTSIEENGKTTEEKLKVLAEEIIRIATKGKTFVLCFEEHEETLSKLIGNNENVLINHFNNIKGSNEYNECTNIFFAGSMYYGDEYYILKSLAINPSNVTSFKTINNNERHLFECDYINNIVRNTKLMDLLQEIFRISIRNYKDKNQNRDTINIYIHEKDKELIDEIIKYLPGAICKAWCILDIRKNKASKEVEVIKHILSKLKVVGDTITKREIDSKCKISSDRRKRVMRSLYLINKLAEYGIDINNRNVEKKSDNEIIIEDNN